MTLFILFLITILCQSQSANGDLLNYMHSRLKAISSDIATTFDGVIGKIKKFFSPDGNNADHRSKIEQYVLEQKIKQAFNDFIEKTAAESIDTESINMRSEPSALMSTPQLATLHGKKVESHVITTKDGYLLTLHRVFKSTSSSNYDKTVLLHHGFLGSSADWLLLGPEKSLPYILSDAGYDVWMTNARGNYYSRGHISKRVNSTQFWKFSFHEMGEYDLPAVIDFIRKVKGYPNQINFIGHSMGATALLVMLSVHPSYNQFIRIGILLAPLAFMSNIRGPLRLLTTMSDRPPKHLLKVIGNTEFLTSRKIPKVMASKFCRGPKMFCTNPLFFFAGTIFEDEILEESFIARLLYHVPAGASTNTILHYGQLVQNGKFHKFGHEAFEYNLAHVKAPMALMTSNDDWLSTVPDVMRLYFSIATPIDHFVLRGKNISHTEFVWGADAKDTVFTKVLEYLTRKTNDTTDNEV